MAKLFIVEDDEFLCATLKRWLEGEHYTVEAIDSGSSALEYLKSYSYDAIILDWDLPDLSGMELLRQFRKHGGTTPVLMLTGKSTLNEKEEGLDSGADDYLTKPFEFRELSARVRALLRRASGAQANTLKAGELVLEPGAYRVTSCGKELRLQPKEFALLEFLMRNPNTVFSGEAIVERVWSSDSDATANTVKSYMHTLRKKLSACGQASLIQTVHGVGYKLVNR